MRPRKPDPTEFRAEIEAHIALEIARLQDEDGLDYEAARAAAHRAFGNVTRVRERSYESGRWLWWDRAVQDVRYAARLLRKSPGFTAIAVLTMALSIGATTAIFALVDATLLAPLPYPHAGQLVTIQDDLPGVGARNVGISEPEWRDFERSGVFDSISPAWYDDNNLTGSAEAARVRLMTVGPAYFAMLGIAPQVGRTFDPADPARGYNLECVISDSLWKGAFAGDPRILERTIRLDTDAYRIVGVMPPAFHAPGRTIQERNVEVWSAAGFSAAPFADPPVRKDHFPAPIGRVKSGLTIADAQRRVDALVATLQKRYPLDYPAADAWSVRLVPLKDVVVGDVRQSLLLLLGAVGLVLLIGCVNVANLLLARASARSRELAIRQALGAARGRLTRQLLTESVLLSLLGGIAGIAVLFLAQGFLVRLVPESLPRLADLSMSRQVLLLALATSLAAGTLFGLAPAFQAGRLNVVPLLKREGRGSTGSREQARTRRALVVTEFALSLVLLVAASLLLRSFWDLLHVELGFNPQRVMTIRTRLPYPNDPNTDLYGSADRVAPLAREIVRSIRLLPGVEEAAVGNSTSLPLDHNQKELDQLPVRFDGGPLGERPTMIDGVIVTPGYFRLMGIALLRGRSFTDFDDEHAPGVVLVNDAMARTFWPGDNPLGKRVKTSRLATSWSTVVGVVANARTDSLEDARVPQVYACLYQRPAKHLAIFLRGQLDPAAVPGQVRTAVQAIDPTLPVYGAQTLDGILDVFLAQRRFSMEIVGLFAVTALVLAAMGIYGVMSYLVGEREHEIGVRLALGAPHGTIMRMVLGQGLELALIGTAIGLACALIVSRIMSGVLYGVRPTDPLTFVSVALVLIGVALLACYVPARRAVRIDALLRTR